MNSNFKALFNTINDGLTAPQTDEYSAIAGLRSDEEIAEAKQLEEKLNANTNGTGKAINALMSAGTALLAAGSITFNLMGGLEGIQEKFNTDTGANLQRIELRQVKAA